MLFLNLNLSKPLQQLLQTNNYKKPTPIQEQVIPLVLEKQDIMAQAQTGSGKSASFVLPILEILVKMTVTIPYANLKPNRTNRTSRSIGCGCEFYWA